MQIFNHLKVSHYIVALFIWLYLMPIIILKAQKSTCFFVNDNEDHSSMSHTVDFCRRVDAFLVHYSSKAVKTSVQRQNQQGKLLMVCFFYYNTM